MSDPTPEQVEAATVAWMDGQPYGDADIESIRGWMRDALRAAAAVSPPTEPNAGELLPAESMALTVALAAVLEGRDPLPNTAATCVLALARLAGRHDWTEDA